MIMLSPLALFLWRRHRYFSMFVGGANADDLARDGNEARCDFMVYFGGTKIARGEFPRAREKAVSGRKHLYFSLMRRSPRVDLARVSKQASVLLALFLRKQHRYFSLFVAQGANAAGGEPSPVLRARTPRGPPSRSATLTRPATSSSSTPGKFRTAQFLALFGSGALGAGASKENSEPRAGPLSVANTREDS